MVEEIYPGPYHSLVCLSTKITVVLIRSRPLPVGIRGAPFKLEHYQITNPVRDLEPLPEPDGPGEGGLPEPVFPQRPEVMWGNRAGVH